MLKGFFAALLALYTAAAMAAVDVNKATAADLDSIKGIGPATATSILDARKDGPFKNWEDLISRVKGIAPTNAGKFSDGGLTVNGQTFTPSKAAPSAAKSAQGADKKAEKQ